MANIFICYNHKDRDFAEALERLLTIEGHNIYFDAKLKAGEVWHLRLKKAIKQADVMIMVMTPESCNSTEVFFEWGLAVGTQVDVIPIKLRGPIFHDRFNFIHHLDFTQPPRPWNQLVGEIGKVAEISQTNPSYTGSCKHRADLAAGSA